MSKSAGQKQGSRDPIKIRDTYAGRVLDEFARSRRQKKALEALEQDNFHEDPHADLGKLIFILI